MKLITPQDINPCNCDNDCDLYPEFGYFKSDCPFNGYDYTQNQVLCITMRCGCMYHPLSKEVINYVQRR
jgi:hypothetical protein